MRSPRKLALLVVWAAITAASSMACSSSDPIEGGAGGGGAATSASSTTQAVATTTTGGATCDDLGLDCGDDNDAGCQGCALDGACKDLAQACITAPDNQCFALNDCYIGCLDGEGACFDACDLQFPGSHDLLENLLLCIFCGECPASCNIDDSACP